MQRSPLAGFRHYDGPGFWSDIRTGDRLELVREPENPYDAGAIRVEWRGVKLGYVPRSVSPQVARFLADGQSIRAWISRKDARRPFGYNSIQVQLDLPLGTMLWQYGS